MAFRFAFEAVLQYRQALEQQQELRLRSANHQVALLQGRIKALESQFAALRDQRCEELGNGTTSAELAFLLRYETLLHEQRHTLERDLARHEALRQQQQVIFQKMRQERETFEKLKDRRRREYERDQKRREQGLL
jgi:flagellar export protein FliJ